MRFEHRRGGRGDERGAHTLEFVEGISKARLRRADGVQAPVMFKIPLCGRRFLVLDVAPLQPNTTWGSCSSGRLTLGYHQGEWKKLRSTRVDVNAFSSRNVQVILVTPAFVRNWLCVCVCVIVP